MSVEKLTNEEATARVREHFKGRCTVHGDAYAQRIFIDLPDGRRFELERRRYVKAHELQSWINAFSQLLDECEVKPTISQ